MTVRVASGPGSAVRRLLAPVQMLRTLVATAATAWLLVGCASAPRSASDPDGASPVVVVVEAMPAPAAQAADAEAMAPEVTAAPVPSDPLQPGVRVDLDDRSARVDLWMRLRNGFAMSDISTDLVRDRERWYADRPDYVARMTERGGRYLFHIVEELERRGMPTELALLPFIESAYNPQAMSVAAASGMWQFIPSTGRDFELKQNVFRDDRRDVLASTRAALDYLQKLYSMFGDWHLALAAYNWGEGSVQRAIAKNRGAGLPTDYLSLRMPAETRLYVPKLQAVKNIVARPADFNLALPELYNHPYFLSVPIEHDMDVPLAARIAGMKLDDFQALNPQMNKPVILAAGTPQVLLPYDNANRFVRELPRYRGPLASWTAWVAPKTMRTAEAAQAVGMSEEQLREVNRIPSRMLIKAGSTLVVPRGQAVLVDVAAHVADNATMALAPDVPPPTKLSLKAGRGDSVASVARRYRVGAAQVAQWNGVDANARFAPGQSVVVYVAGAAARRPATRSAPSTVAATTARAQPVSTTAAKATVAKASTTRTRVARSGRDGARPVASATTPARPRSARVAATQRVAARHD